MTNLDAALTLEELSRHENFKTWEFGRMSQVLIERDMMLAHMPPDIRTRQIEFPVDPPWDGEPDKVQWIDPTTGYDCLILRNQMGALCGYVGVPPEHPYHSADYDAAPVDVHGGLTFASPCAEEGGDDQICHTPAPGHPDNVWWLGFDCAHAWDLVPALAIGGIGPAVYRNLGYVVAEITQLAAQLKALNDEHQDTINSLRKRDD